MRIRRKTNNGGVKAAGDRVQRTRKSKAMKGKAQAEFIEGQASAFVPPNYGPGGKAGHIINMPNDASKLHQISTHQYPVKHERMQRGNRNALSSNNLGGLTGNLSTHSLGGSLGSLNGLLSPGSSLGVGTPRTASGSVDLDKLDGDEDGSGGYGFLDLEDTRPNTQNQHESPRVSDEIESMVGMIRNASLDHVPSHNNSHSHNNSPGGTGVSSMKSHRSAVPTVLSRSPHLAASKGSMTRTPSLLAIDNMVLSHFMCFVCVELFTLLVLFRVIFSLVT